MRDVAAGDSYMSTHDPRLHFGLGKAEKVDKVDVKWPDGSHTVLENLHGSSSRSRNAPNP